MHKFKQWVAKNKATVRALLVVGLVGAGVGPVLAPLVATLAVDTVAEVPEA